ncbi:MAG: stage III sporulation protein AB [Clostridia bacterium]|nr:stage III sporulation protein AB [Clostridia bacterium]
MIKIIGIILLIMSGVLSGFIFYSKYNLKVSFLTQYINFITVLRNEIRYSQKPLVEILKNFRCENPLSKYISRCTEYLNKTGSFKKSWDAAFKDCGCLGISGEEQEIIKNFGSTLGSCDVSGQIHYCDYNLDMIKPYLLSSKEKRKSKGKLSVILCVGISVLISIVLI